MSLTTPAPRPRGTPLEVLLAALRLGLTSFGGPIAHLGYFRREYVERRRWLDEASFAELVALSQLLPGPASSQVGIGIGARRAGPMGGLMAWVGFTLPSAILLVLFAMLTKSVDVSQAGWVHGLKIAAVAVVAQAVYLMARTLTPDWPRQGLAAAGAAVALLWVTPLSQVAIIGGGAVLGLLLLTPPAEAAGAREPAPIPRRLAIACLLAFIALLVGLPVLRAVTGAQAISLFEAFYRTGALVFGGGHVVLPLLHTTVVDPGWVGNDRFLAGYGAAQAVPGPLFSFAAYLGAAASVPPNGWVGAGIALVAIFLPSFLLVFAALPFWDQLRGEARFRRALAGINAVVVGILLAALITPIGTGAIVSWIDAGAAAVALALLFTGRVPPIVVVALAATAGQLVMAPR